MIAMLRRWLARKIEPKETAPPNFSHGEQVNPRTGKSVLRNISRFGCRFRKYGNPMDARNAGCPVTFNMGFGGFECEKCGSTWQ